MTATTTARLALVCATVAGLSGTAARAEEGVAFKNLLGSMGMIPKDKDPIRYRERAPLVIPPRMELREPAAPESFASSNPQWPNDPDVAARKRRVAEQRNPVTESEIRRMSERNVRLTPQEMQQGRSVSAEQAVPGRYMTDRVAVLTPDELRAGAKKDDGDGAISEPVRRTLADPPGTYRKAAGTGSTGASSVAPRFDQQQADANPINWLTRKFSRSEDDE